MSDGSDPFEFLKAFWNPLGLPMATMVTPTLNIPEVEKRIADLKLVENWLTMNLSVLRMSIQTLEMQKATLAAMKSAQPAGAAVQNQALDAWLKMVQAGMGGNVPPPDPVKPEGKPE